MSNRNLLSVAAAVIAAAALLAGAGVSTVRAADAAATPAAAPSTSGNLAPAIELEPKALGILKGASDKLAAAKSLSFKAVVSEESPSRLGPPLAYYTVSEVLLERPNKLRVVSPGDGPRSEFYYDGKSMVAYSPAENMVARAPAPGTIDAMLEAAFKTAQIYFPYTDLLVTDPYKGLSEGLRVAFYVGQSDSVGGVKTHIIAYANDHAFVQAWIGVDDRMPRRLQAVFRNDPLQLRHSVNLSDWRLDAAVPAGAFTPPEKARKALPIAFGNPAAMPSGDRSSAAKKQ
jgi:hypothetical protein